MADNQGIQRLFGGFGNDCCFEGFLPIIIIGAILLCGEELIEFICCNGEIVLIFLVILALMLFC